MLCLWNSAICLGGCLRMGAQTKLPWIPSFEEILHAACWLQHNRRPSIETIHLFNFHFIGYLLYYRVSTGCLERYESD